MGGANNRQNSTTFHEVKSLVLSQCPIIAIETVEEDRVDALVQSISRQLRMPLFEWSVTKGLRRFGEKLATHGTAQPSTLLKHLSGLTVEAIFVLKDFVSYLEDPAVRRLLRELASEFHGKRSTLILTGPALTLPDEVSHLSVQYTLKFPDENELRFAVAEILRSLRTRKPFDIDLNPGELEELIRALGGMTLKQARQAVAYCVLDDGRLSRDDISMILEKKSQSLRKQGLLEYYSPDGNHYDLGGFKNLRAWLSRVRVGFSKEAQQYNLTPPKGILLVGVQGCGKSLAAKYVARDWNLPLLRLDAARLFDKYIGESEKNFFRSVRQAEAMAPAVLWIDEIEKGLGVGKESEADGGVGLRLLGAFLTWLQEKTQEVFVVATANDLNSLPPELLRKGRFDEIFFVDLPNEEERRSIFEIHLRIRKQDPGSYHLERLAKATEGFSGAEIEQLVISALYRALHEKSQLDTGLLIEEVGKTIPLSVSRSEEISSLRAWAKKRFVSVT